MIKQRQRNWYKYAKLNKESDSDEETELFVQNKPTRKEIQTVDKVLEEGDTLQSIAIHYQCRIEDLKRLNNIHRENEIFARRTIKVPARPISEMLAEVHASGTSTEDASQNNDKLIDLSPNGVANTEDLEVNFIIFNTTIAQKPMEAARQLPPVKDHTLLPHKTSNKLKCSGDDCGISWVALVFCIIIVIVVIPLIYVFYLAEHLENFHHRHLKYYFNNNSTN